MPKKHICSLCKMTIDGSHANYCNACFTNYMYFSRHNSEAKRLKTVARAVAMNRFKAGIIVKEDCRLCGSPDSEMHHPDYSKPKDIVWLCKKCHHELHTLERKVLCG